MNGYLKPFGKKGLCSACYKILENVRSSLHMGCKYDQGIREMQIKFNKGFDTREFDTFMMINLLKKTYGNKTKKKFIQIFGNEKLNFKIMCDEKFSVLHDVCSFVRLSQHSGQC